MRHSLLREGGPISIVCRNKTSAAVNAAQHERRSASAAAFQNSSVETENSEQRRYAKRAQGPFSQQALQRVKDIKQTERGVAPGSLAAYYVCAAAASVAALNCALLRLAALRRTLSLRGERGCDKGRAEAENNHCGKNHFFHGTSPCWTLQFAKTTQSKSQLNRCQDIRLTVWFNRVLGHTNSDCRRAARVRCSTHCYGLAIADERESLLSQNVQ
jgi:hypothetical protein